MTDKYDKKIEEKACENIFATCSCCNEFMTL